MHKSVKGNIDKVVFELDVAETNMMQSLLKFDEQYSDKYFSVAFVVKDAYGEIKYKRSMTSGGGKIINYDTKY